MLWCSDHIEYRAFVVVLFQVAFTALVYSDFVQIWQGYYGLVSDVFTMSSRIQYWDGLLQRSSHGTAALSHACFSGAYSRKRDGRSKDACYVAAAQGLAKYGRWESGNEGQRQQGSESVLLVSQ